MFIIVIGEYGEYGLRLGKYLESHWDGPLRIHSFTLPDMLLSCEERADCYLLGETFMRDLKEELPPEIQSRSILISDEEKEGHFCRYHAPKELLSLMERRGVRLGQAQEAHLKKKKLYAVFSPVYEEELRRIAGCLMKPGDLYLGMEDVGDFQNDRGNMGDLCYYIGLKDPEVSVRAKEMAAEEDGMWFIDSPPVFYDLLELKEEEYRWFFDRLREEGEWGDIYVGTGSGVFSLLAPLLDVLILVDCQSHQRRHMSCDYVEQAMCAKAGRFSGRCERRYREEF